MYTDGLSEAMNNADEEFGEERIVDLLREHKQMDNRSLLALLEKEVLRFRGKEELEDDFTLLLVNTFDVE